MNFLLSLIKLALEAIYLPVSELNRRIYGFSIFRMRH